MQIFVFFLCFCLSWFYFHLLSLLPPSPSDWESIYLSRQQCWRGPPGLESFCSRLFDVEPARLNLSPRPEFSLPIIKHPYWVRSQGCGPNQTRSPLVHSKWERNTNYRGNLQNHSAASNIDTNSCFLTCTRCVSVCSVTSLEIDYREGVKAPTKLEIQAQIWPFLFLS